MNALSYLFRFVYRIRWWLIVAPVAVAFLAFPLTANLPREYEVSTTLYTGVVSGSGIGAEEGRQDWNSINNVMDNIVNVITAQSTLKHLSMRLYVQHMIHGDPERDNNYITAANYRAVRGITPPDVMALIDESSEERTLANLYAYEQASPKNFIYGLFNWHHRHYSYEALSRIAVRRVGSSDMLEVSYTADDPGIAYHTLVLLNEEFVKQYQQLRFGETDDVIRYFEEELARIGRELRLAEDSLTSYNIQKKVINYDEQTKHIAALNRDFELTYEGILLDYNSAKELSQSLETRMDEHVKQLRNNALFIEKLRTISDLTAKIAAREPFQTDSLAGTPPGLDALYRQRQEAEADFDRFVRTVGEQQYTKEGISSFAYVEQWLNEILRLEKAKAQLAVMEKRREKLDNQYLYFSPVGSTIKRKEREINFSEQSYLSVLNNLNAARLRQKSIQMTTATPKTITPPTFPLASAPTRRKLIVAGAFLGALAFVFGYFLLLELLDRTLRGKFRTERITGGKVLGATPADRRFRYRAYNQACQDIAVRFVGNAVSDYFRSGSPNIVNLLSTGPNEGKSLLAERLASYWRAEGLTVKVVQAGKSFPVAGKVYLFAGSLMQLIGYEGEDVVLVEYPDLAQHSVPAPLLREARVNLMVAHARHVWKDTDQLLYDKAKEQAGDAPVLFCLTGAQCEAVEIFTGLLPPYNRLRKWSYRLSQMGLSAEG